MFCAPLSLLHVIARQSVSPSLPCKGRCRATRGGGVERSSAACSQDGSCAMRSTLPHLPFPGLLRDGPPRARLRSAKTALVCHRQRQSSRPHLLFVLPKRRRSAPGPEEKGAHAMNLCTVTGLVIAIVGHGTCPVAIVGLRAAAARGRRRRHGISAAALFAGRRKAGPQKANAARWDSLSPLFPRGAASLGAALGTGRGWVFCTRFPFARHCEAPSGAAAIRSFFGRPQGSELR